MSYSKLFILVLLNISVLTNVTFAGNKLSCSYSYKSGYGNGCFFSSMRLFDQLSDVDDGNNYCAPTSAAMALSALTYGGVSYYTSSWTKKNFVNKSTKKRIEAFAGLMRTSKDSGTSDYYTKRFKKRDGDFPDATENLDKANSIKLYDSHMRSLVRRGEVNVLAYGHYEEDCTGTGSSRVCKYDVDGGHVVAVNGYFYTSGSSTYTTHIFDPWGGAQRERDITKLSDKTKKKFMGFDLDYRPFGGKTYYLRKSGSNYKIIEYVSGVNSN